MVDDAPLTVIRPWPNDTPPWFKLWVNDLLGASAVAKMDTKTFGAYIFILTACWEDGAVDDDADELRVLTRLERAEFKKVWPRLKKCFRPTACGRLHSPRMTEERVKAMEASTEAKRKADLRWEKKRQKDAAALLAAQGEDNKGDTDAMPQHPPSTAEVMPQHAPGIDKTGASACGGDAQGMRLQTTDERKERASSSPPPNAVAPSEAEAPEATEVTDLSASHLDDAAATELAKRFFLDIRAFSPQTPRPQSLLGWGAPLRKLHDEDGVTADVILDHSHWLFLGEYRPDHAGYDLRTRAIDPRRFRQEFHTIAASCSSAQAILDDPALPACPACQRHVKFTTEVGVDTFTCEHKRVWMFLDRYTCPRCEVAHKKRRTGGSCLDCEDAGGPPNDAIHAWLRDRMPTQEISEEDV